MNNVFNLDLASQSQGSRDSTSVFNVMHMGEGRSEASTGTKIAGLVSYEMGTIRGNALLPPIFLGDESRSETPITLVNVMRYRVIQDLDEVKLESIDRFSGWRYYKEKIL